jgi:hypothetical protein
MQEFIAKYQDQIQGALSGSDRVVFAGALRKLNYSHWEPELKAPRAIAMEHYLAQRHILCKDYAAHVKAVSECIKWMSLAPFRQDDLPVIHLPPAHMDKDATTREVARRRGIQKGRVCAITAVELHPRSITTSSSAPFLRMRPSVHCPHLQGPIRSSGQITCD